jgi:hypothetical protein
MLKELLETTIELSQQPWGGSSRGSNEPFMEVDHPIDIRHAAIAPPTRERYDNGPNCCDMHKTSVI